MPRGYPDLITVVGRDDRRQSLIAIRDRLARELQSVEGRDVAILSKELRDVMRELDELPSSERVDPLDQLAGSVADDLAARRAARRTDATGT